MSNPVLIESLRNKFGTVKVNGDWARIPCPTCVPKDRKKMKRFIPVHGYTSNCFICGQRKSIQELLDGYYVPIKSDFIDAPDINESKEPDPRSLVLPYIEAIPVNQLLEDHPAIKFLYKDELRDLDTYANIHKIVYVPYEGGMIFSNGGIFITSAEHLVFPVFFEQKLVGWQLRSVPGTFYGDQKKDVRYYHIFNKGSYLYNYDIAKLSKRVVVVEGVKKALKFKNAVATWGTGVSRKQLKLIQQWPEVIMMLDADKDNNTQQRAREFVDGINAGGSSKAINVNLEKYGVSSPDDLPANILQMIADQEWNEQTNNNQ